MWGTPTKQGQVTFWVKWVIGIIVRSILSVLIWYQNQVHTTPTFWDIAVYPRYVRVLLAGYPLWQLVTCNNYWKTMISDVLMTVTLLIQIQPKQCNADQSRLLLFKFGGHRAFLNKLTSRWSLTFWVILKCQPILCCLVKDPADQIWWS